MPSIVAVVSREADALAVRQAVLEIGAGQGEAALAVFEAAGAGPVTLHPDLDGRDRVVEIRRVECDST